MGAQVIRRILLALVLSGLGGWCLAGAALAWSLPPGWKLREWPISFPGFTVIAPPGAALRWSPLDWRRLRVAGQGLEMPGPHGGHPWGRLAALDAELVLHGPLAPGGGLPGMLTAWRDAGGVLELRGFSLLWGPLRVSGAGELRLSVEGGLTGVLHGRIEGLAESAAALAAAGMIPPAEARAAGMVRDAAQGTALSLRDGFLVLCTLPVLPLR